MRLPERSSVGDVRQVPSDRGQERGRRGRGGIPGMLQLECARDGRPEFGSIHRHDGKPQSRQVSRIGNLVIVDMFAKDGLPRTKDRHLAVLDCRQHPAASGLHDDQSSRCDRILIFGNGHEGNHGTLIRDDAGMPALQQNRPGKDFIACESFDRLEKTRERFLEIPEGNERAQNTVPSNRERGNHFVNSGHCT